MLSIGTNTGVFVPIFSVIMVCQKCRQKLSSDQGLHICHSSSSLFRHIQWYNNVFGQLLGKVWKKVKVSQYLGEWYVDSNVPDHQHYLIRSSIFQNAIQFSVP